MRTITYSILVRRCNHVFCFCCYFSFVFFLLFSFKNSVIHHDETKKTTRSLNEIKFFFYSVVCSFVHLLPLLQRLHVDNKINIHLRIDMVFCCYCCLQSFCFSSAGFYLVLMHCENETDLFSFFFVLFSVEKLLLKAKKDISATIEKLLCLFDDRIQSDQCFFLLCYILNRIFFF